MNQTIDLAQACEPGVEISQSAFQHLAMTWILNRFELLKNSPARKLNRIFFLLHGSLFRCKSLF